MSEPRFTMIPSEQSLLEIVRRGLEDANISQNELADLLKTEQTTISKKLAGKRHFSLEDFSEITSLILERLSNLPQESTKKLYAPSKNVVYVNSDDTVAQAAKKMREGDFTQLPVYDREKRRWLGMVTDYTLLKRIITPDINQPKNKNIRSLKDMTLKDSKVIDSSPVYNINTPLREIAQALVFHYALLINEEEKYENVDEQGRIEHEHLGIVTRWDFLKLLE